MCSYHRCITYELERLRDWRAENEQMLCTALSVTRQHRLMKGGDLTLRFQRLVRPRPDLILTRTWPRIIPRTGFVMYQEGRTIYSSLFKGGGDEERKKRQRGHEREEAKSARQVHHESG